MKKVIILILVASGLIHANSTEDFLRVFVCKYAPEHREYKPDTIRDLIASHYKYANRSIRLIEKYENKVARDHKRTLIDMEKMFVRYRGIVDNMIEVSYSTDKSTLSALHNIVNDDGLGVLSNYIKIFGIDQKQMLAYADRLDKLEKDIGFQAMSLLEDIDPYHRLNCN